ncbi:hypothetical protein A3A93_02365 [Candidatus Roizmanbacteria bacterium RIFCSPLOWO2_01_FULL_38_12]|uniref:Glycosyltransferase subfamily 4-like N-terminal domain-containing protein n=1 Tax=Candidatus Roizmanbacteria bacterium RIFCSPLOWO2_01_FULL_38_12 TaxID=1802061 RepID=A0A1F7IWA4_9BACT|nr:MAG: hypothetical protein A2861_02105 [Candidatus Roizmanbacteria bacterium RIFCSPHIGHO2_01_FULL_38_15]OGK35585.1 MAG: hypothetical protein A3F59_02500 [Candidatus Roizmanbacteria bacterium RIFCSPHIGHO2_12_FULL_38_13]OGK47660.1 MAG: hypothetical protein A3A93_02365 [Candidatus Roizmanbacteria bacterium RIFCSPLOWO2_01_FULL_38_12]
MLTPYLPYPPASGGQIRTLYLLKYLGKNHDITLVALYKDNHEKSYADYLKSYCKEIYLCKRATNPWQLQIILKAIFSALPFLIVRNFSQEAKTIIEKLLKEKHFDVIHAETFYIMPHIPKTNIPTLLVEQTVEYKVYQHFISTLPFYLRLPFSVDILKLKMWETFYWQKADLVATVSDSDQHEIQKLTKNLKSVVIPNGAGDEMFVDRFPKLDKKNPKLLFVGNFFWLQNVEAAKYLINKILPRLLVSMPETRLIIAGQNSTKKLGKQANSNVSIIDLAPDDGETVKKLYQTSTIFIAPIFGPGGTRLKILASMAAGLPVISTKVGVEGLGVKDGVHVLIAHGPAEFVEKITDILDNEVQYKIIQKNAHALVKKHFSWKAIAQKLENVYRGIGTQL